MTKHIDVRILRADRARHQALDGNARRRGKDIRRLIEDDGKFGGLGRHEADALGCDLLAIDETLIPDMLLFRALVRALPPRAAPLLVGDAG